jgi:hypothetical protein
VTEYCCVNLVAENTLINISAEMFSYHGTNINDIADQLNSDLNVISDWLKVNRLKLNVDKTKISNCLPQSSFTTGKCTYVL